MPNCRAYRKSSPQCKFSYHTFKSPPIRVAGLKNLVLYGWFQQNILDIAFFQLPEFYTYRHTDDSIHRKHNLFRTKAVLRWDRSSYSLIIQMDCPVVVINFFSAAQIYYTKMAWIFLRIIMDLLNTFFADILRPTQIFIWNKGESQQAVLLLFGENLSTGLDFVEFWVSRSPKLLI